MSIGGARKEIMGARWSLGRAISGVGTALRLPEYGLSEKVGGGNQTYDYVSPQGAQASAAGGGGGLSAVPKADGGYDFFMGGTPITYEQYIAAGGPRPTGMNDVSKVDLSSAATTTDTTGDGSGTPYTADIVSYMGVDYDLNNPTDRQAFYQLKSAEIDKQLTDALQKGNLQYAGQLAQAQDQMTQYIRDWDAQGKELLSGYSTGMTNRQQFFQGLGSRAYQSSMGTSGQNALNKLGEAQDERNYQKTQAQNQNQQAISGLEQSYNDWVAGAGQSAQAAKDELKTTQANIQGYTGADVAPIAGQADLSAYTPYTTFNQLQASPLVQQQSTTPKPVAQMTLSEWLQQQQTGKTGKTLEDYLAGRA